MNDLIECFENKKVLITGHTGFKGSWLTLWLNNIGANILGISKDIPTNPSHFEYLKFEKNLKTIIFDIKDYKLIKKAIKDFQPDFIFHLAAQSIVNKSYTNTLSTWETNLMGTINLLESLKDQKKKIVTVIVTSDKSYKNLETKRGYGENDLLGGIDPYGASKSATEIAITSYVKSFFNSKNNNIFIGIGRAGNVIGGGDWSSNRLIPDCMKSWLLKKKVLIRNPNSTRPWQHVLEVIHGYLQLAMEIKKDKSLHGEAFNFGPNMKKNFKVIEILNLAKKNWSNISWKIEKNKNNFFENKLLNLNNQKSKKILKWKPNLTFNQRIYLTIDWYRQFYKNKKNINNISLEQLKFYQKICEKK